MNMRARKRRITAAQQAWSRANASTGFIPVAWFASRHPRIVPKLTRSNAVGAIDQWDVYVTPASTS